MDLVPQDNPATPRTPASAGASPLDDLVSPGARVLKAQALARAAYKGDLETVEELLDEGVSPNSKDAYGCASPPTPCAQHLPALLVCLGCCARERTS